MKSFYTKLFLFFKIYRVIDSFSILLVLAAGFRFWSNV